MPQPARHFLFATLGTALLIGLLIRAKLTRIRDAVLVGCALVIANQLAAELIYQPVVNRYSWVYPQMVDHRSTQQVPLGLFVADQRANRDKTLMVRAEAIRLLHADIDRVAVLGEDDCFYLLAKALAESPSARVVLNREPNGLLVYEVLDGERRFAVVVKRGVWPSDGIKASTGLPRFRGWRFFVQPSSVSKYDRDEVPAERRFVLSE